MRLEKSEDGKILIWETGRQTNNIEYRSWEDIEKYTRRNLSMFETFLRSVGEYKEANKINLHLGKILRNKTIPQLIPTGHYRINTHVSMLKGTIDRYIKEYGLNLDPDFQRGHVWNMKQRVAYVEFILQGGKTNPIYFNHTAWMKSMDGEMVIVDGKQRLTSLLMFLNDEFTVFKNLDKEGVGYYASEFDYIPDNIEIVINDLPTRKQVLQWYLQMNKGNVAHTEDELSLVEKLLEKEL